MMVKSKTGVLETAISFGVVAVFLIAWFAVTSAGIVSETLIPTPQSVWESCVTIVKEGYKGSTLLEHLGASMSRLIKAYLIAIVTAVPLGLLSGYNSKIKALIEPIVEFYRPLPPLAYYTLLVLWMGIGDGSKIMLLFLAGFAPIYIACVSGVNRIKEDYILGAKTLGADSRQVFFFVIFPAVLPDIFTGLRTSLGVEYTTLVAAEMVAAVSGIGWLVLDASNYLRSDIMFFGIILMGITGILLDQIIRLLEKRIIHWKGKN
ncbi:MULTISPECIES: ABC transporter permease [Anaerostipes]|uniref:ABC transporter permease n=1 Tax=Anaerostipes TaxID=207244 RepID=UPI00095142D2|nr:ABC transporter permease [Anaerostipes sp. 494a]OLR59995.1 taurine ABC transporter permease [Anaerostipes sp. 494a]